MGREFRDPARVTFTHARFPHIIRSMNFTNEDYRVLSTMIAPALFMTATGSLIMSTNNRVSRIVDRFRVISGLVEKIGAPGSNIDFPKLRLDFFTQELVDLRRRAGRIRIASAMLYFAFAMFVASSLVIGLDLIAPIRIFNIPTILSLTGVASVFWACINLFLETRTAVRTVDRELSFLEQLQRERLTAPETSNEAGIRELPK